jgi:hypothetical protein
MKFQPIIFIMWKYWNLKKKGNFEMSGDKTITRSQFINFDYVSSSEKSISSSKISSLDKSVLNKNHTIISRIDTVFLGL